MNSYILWDYFVSVEFRDIILTHFVLTTIYWILYGNYAYAFCSI